MTQDAQDVLIRITGDVLEFLTMLAFLSFAYWVLSIVRQRM